MSVTIKDIAREAGVSFSTVSSVLRSCNCQGGSASTTTRSKIVRIARELNYQPSNIARGLRTGHSKLIAFLSRTFEAALTLEAMIGAETVCHRNDYHIVLGTFNTPDRYRALLESLMRKRVDGILVPFVPEEEYRKVQEDFSRKVPMINLFGSSFSTCPGVFVNGSEIGRLAAEYLLGLGHQRILLTGERANCCEAFRECFFAAGLPAENLIHWPGLNSFEDGKVIVKRLLTEQLPVTAIFAYNDANAAGILQETARLGLSIPEDFSVLGVNNSDLCQMLSPALTTVAQPQREQGSQATEALLKIINGNKVEDIVLAPYLVIRNSCGKVNEKLIKYRKTKCIISPHKP